LLGTNGEDEAIVIGGGDSVAAAEAADAEGENSGEGFVCGAADQAMEEVVALSAGREEAFAARRTGAE
jgi:hypothetical protein